MRRPLSIARSFVVRRRRGIALLLAPILQAIVAWRTPLRFHLLDLHAFARPIDSVTVVDRHGRTLRQTRVDGIDQRWVELEDVSPHVVAAFVAAEDHRFWSHDGADWRSVARASWTNVLPGRRLSGASTITQQVVKLVYRRPYGVLSKTVEVLRAFVLEELTSKRFILEQYLNRVPFGDRIHGVARASEAYFGRPVSDVTPAQAALLAGIPQAPTATEPRRHLARATRRRNVVLRRMLETGVLDEVAYASAVREPVRIVASPVRAYEAPRFVDHTLEAWAAGRVRMESGRLATTLDLALQHSAEDALRRAVDTYRPRGVQNGAAIVVASETGEVLAYVAAAHRGVDAPAGQMDLLRRGRQPGSTLKPFVYALLFDRGGTAATVLDDIAQPMTGVAGERFSASDYDGSERGPVAARTALSASLNLAALDAARRVGADAILAKLRGLGFSQVLGPEHHGAAVVLGGIDVSAEEIACAYVALARGGSAVPLSYGRDPVLEPLPPRRVFHANATAVVTDILRDGQAREDEFGDDLERVAGGPFALKTGTSTGWRDAWAAVYDDRHTVVVWLGNPMGRALSEVSGFEAAALVAAAVLRLARERAEANDTPSVRQGMSASVTVTICPETGLLAGAHCPHRASERFLPGTAPRERCRAHGPDGSLRVGARYALWVDRTRPAGISRSTLDSRRGQLRVVQPANGEALLVPAGAEIPLRAARGRREVADVSWEVDGRGVEGAWWLAEAGKHEIVAVSGRERTPITRVIVEVGMLRKVGGP